MSSRLDWGAWKRQVLTKIDPSRTALAVIDLQNDFCADWGALAALGSDVSPCRLAADRVASFLPLVRPRIPVTAFFRLEYDPLRLSESQRERLLRDGRPIICAPSTPGSEFFITPEPGDHVFTKHRYSAFTNKDFRHLLHRRAIDTVAVAGVDTHICVEGTVRQGYDLGYRMLVLADLVSTRQSESNRHRASLALCERYFGLVIESSTFLEVLAASIGTPTAPSPLASL